MNIDLLKSWMGTKVVISTMPDCKNVFMICEIAGSDCITYEDGQKVFKVIDGPLSAGQSVKLDFSAVEVMTSRFLNAAFGTFLKGMTPDEFFSRVEFIQIDKQSKRDVIDCVENAFRFYADAVNQELMSKLRCKFLE